MAHWVGTLEAAWFQRVTAGTAVEGVRWEPPAGSRPQIDEAGLLVQAGDTRLVSSVRLDSAGTNFRFVLHITASQSGGIGGGSQDLSATWESNHNVRIVSRGETWDLPLAATDDPTEHYIYVIPEDDRAAFDAFIAAVGAGNAAHGGTITLWDGQGTNPFGGPDTTAPTLQSADTNAAGTAVVLTFDEELDSTAAPDTGAFAIEIDGASVSLQSLVVSGTTVTLNLATSAAVEFGDAVTVSYAVPTNNPLRDLASNPAAAFTDQAVTNSVPNPDQFAPTLSTTTLPETNAAGTTITLTFNEALDTAHVPAPGDFNVQVAGARRNVATGGVALSGSAVVLTLASAVANGETVTAAYTNPGDATSLQDAAGNAVATFAAQTVNNNVPALPWTLDLPHRLGSTSAATRRWDASIPSGRTEDGIANAALQVVVTYLPDPDPSFSIFAVEIFIGTGSGNSFVDVPSGQDLTEELEGARLSLQNADGSVTLWQGILSEVDSGSSEPYDLNATEDETQAIHGQTGALRLLFEEPNIRIAGIGVSEVGGRAAALGVAAPDDVRVAGIGASAIGGRASTLTVTRVADVRIAGIGVSTVGGRAAALGVTAPDDIRIAGIGTSAVGGRAAALIVDPLGSSFPHEGTLTKSGDWWNESPGTLSPSITTASSGDQALNVRIAVRSGSWELRIRLSGGTTVEFSDPVEQYVRLALWDGSAAADDDFLIDVPLSGDPDSSARYDIPISEARYDAIEAAGNTLYYRLHIAPAVRIAGFDASAIGGRASALGVTPPADVRVAGIGSSAIGGRATLGVAPPADIRITGIGASQVGGRAALSVGQVPDVRIAGIGATAVGGRASLTVARVGDILIAGIGASPIGGRSAAPIVTRHGNPDVRIAGIGVSSIGGQAATLTVREPTPLTPDQAAAVGKAHTRDLTRDSDLFALVITHPDIDAPIRVVADNLDITIDGNTFTALAFRAQPPNFQEGETPRAVLEIDNIGRELTQWVETTGGGRGAMIEVMQVLRDPEVPTVGHVVWSLPSLPVGVTEVNNEVVQVALAYRTGRSRPGIKWRHDPETSPGAFQ